MSLLAQLQCIYHKIVFVFFGILLRVCLRVVVSEVSLQKTTSLLPQRVQYGPIVPDAQQLIGRRDPVGVGILGIPEDGVREPDQADHIAEWFKKAKRKTKKEHEGRDFPAQSNSRIRQAPLLSKTVINNEKKGRSRGNMGAGSKAHQSICSINYSLLP